MKTQIFAIEALGGIINFIHLSKSMLNPLKKEKTETLQGIKSASQSLFSYKFFGSFLNCTQGGKRILGRHSPQGRTEFDTRESGLRIK